ncbi:Benzil reductase ((S)-benzoin forming) [Peribacillus sp. Bi96]|uniref:(S)-benzoin forming benzil reductase n=1 Tax=unclassified Peribacillus TaxID=2675266 RepID=UPI001E0F2127|nr:(S)-benzoin forming benzil reductase [Peribacillus sp. Bi96]CAH0148103.1 Benzil reductase ((S)-benzoin forming) [Peribacillus sp. Bi96]
MKTFIITGASKGLGAAIAKKCLQTSDHCILISRTAHPDMALLAAQFGTKLTVISMDLNETEKLTSLINEVLAVVDQKSDIYFINNAGVIEPIKPIGNLGQENLETSMRVNFLAPIVLADEFIKQTKDWNRKKVMVNISSGAAKNPYHGWAAYCSTKAGLEMFTRVAGVEQDKVSFPTSLISFSPGVMDTEMQGIIRSADEHDFSDRNKFHEYKEKGMLRSPELVAEKLLQLLEVEELENGKFYDIKNLL